jgi:chlorite dismutase/nitrite reductase/ring-hydroxylating ferredoxin subunit
VSTPRGNHSSSADRRSDRQGRQFVKFSFFKVADAFRRLPDDRQRAAKLELVSAIRTFNRRMLLRSYSLVGLRGDVDFLLWQVAPRPEPFQELMTAILSTALGPYLSMPHSFFAITRRSIYDIGEMVEGDAAAERIVIQPGDHAYLFVYPFVKTRPWYALSQEERQAMIDEHIRIGRKYPDIKLNTTYSYGIDDQEFVVAFEGDDPSQFVDLVMDLRFSEASMYTLRDTPMFTCRSLPLPETFDSLGGPPIAADAALDLPDAEGWTTLLPLAELPPGTTTTVYAAGKQVALFNVGETVYALSNRCSHARGPLSEGTVDAEACEVTCPWHYAKFDLASGRVVDGVAQTAVPAYETEIRDGQIRIRERQAEAAVEEA